MITLKNDNPPPNGWSYTQAETGWNNLERSPVSQWDLNLLIREIAAHRRANPRFNLSTDFNQIKQEVKYTNALRLLSMPNTESYLMQDTAPTPSVLKKVLRPLRKLPGAAVANLISGAGTIIDWLGSGGQPVAKELAEQRASVCVTCPMNQDGDWFIEKASQLIKAQIGMKNDLSLKTSVDDKLYTCKVCLCPLPLKVWAPLDTVRAHMKDEVRKELPDFCWINREG